ncbi:MAG: 4-hydroxy-3-methylbut-2-enyl diphosphate reductase, partial [Bacteroidota bacterium]
QTQAYNTTCPFVERVWKKSEQIGASNHTIIIHGKYNHEETRSTFSRSEKDAQAVLVLRDMAETEKLIPFIFNQKSQLEFEQEFANKFSEGFNIQNHFEKIGVINQTTMLATETQEIADYLKSMMAKKYADNEIKNHFADTRDTLCYATKENQDATLGLLKISADLAIVVGGYNSSNTQHLVELCEQKFKTYFVSSEKEIENSKTIHHFNLHNKCRILSRDFLPEKAQISIIITSGASCPDSMLDQVINKINAFFHISKTNAEVLKELHITNP